MSSKAPTARTTFIAVEEVPTPTAFERFLAVLGLTTTRFLKLEQARSEKREMERERLEGLLKAAEAQVERMVDRYGETAEARSRRLSEARTRSFNIVP